MSGKVRQAKAVYLLAALVGLSTATVLTYAFYRAMVLSPGNPWAVFELSRAFLQFHGLVYAIGAVLWILGTALFAFELAGYTPARKGFVRNGTGVRQWSVIDVALSALSAAVYGGLLTATAPIVIVPGATWLRPANSLAPLFGMFFGIPGCLGVAIGNLIADIFGGFFGVGSIGGFVGNFLIAYLPYKFIRDHSFSTASSLGQFYIWGVIVQAIYSALYICWWVDFARPIIGVPLFVVWGIIAPAILLNNITVNAVISPPLGRLLYLLIKGRGLYWKDRVGAQA